MRLRPGMYDAWRVREEDFPRSGNLGEQLRFLVRYAILAPSAHNTQPWRFAIADNHLRVLFDESRALTVSDPTRREMIVSVGAAVANLLVAAEHFGFRAAVEEFPLGDHRAVADVAVAPSPGARTPDGDRLFRAIPQRHANRHLYEPRKVSPDILMKFRGFATAGDPHLDLVEEPAKIQQLGDLTENATAASMRSPQFRAELSQWVRSNFTKRPDGMPGFAVGIPDVPSLLAPLMVRMSLIAKQEAGKRRAQVLSSPVLGIISTKGNEKRDWFRSGMLLEKIWLLSAAEGLRLAVLAAVIETGELYRDVQRILGSALRPQACFRVGCGPEDPHPTPRRPLEDVLHLL